MCLFYRSTESYDYLPPVGDDPHWDIFVTFNAYLRVSFPKTFAMTRVTAVNTHNIVLHLGGSDRSLKPILLTAHQDVVPVEPSTVPLWKYPPYSGHYDGQHLSSWIAHRRSSTECTQENLSMGEAVLTI